MKISNWKTLLFGIVIYSLLAIGGSAAINASYNAENPSIYVRWSARDAMSYYFTFLCGLATLFTISSFGFTRKDYDNYKTSLIFFQANLAKALATLDPSNLVILFGNPHKADSDASIASYHLEVARNINFGYLFTESEKAVIREYIEKIESFAKIYHENIIEIQKKFIQTKVEILDSRIREKENVAKGESWEKASSLKDLEQKKSLTSWNDFFKKEIVSLSEKFKDINDQKRDIEKKMESYYARKFKVND